MGTPIKFEDVDFFGLKLLDKKDCRFCIRSGKAFMYVDNQRFDFEDTPQSSEVIKVGNFETSNMDTSKDITINGFIMFWQNQEHYAAVIFDHTRKHDPMAIRFGNVLEEMENV